MPEHEPQVGQAFSSTSASCASVTVSSALRAIASIRSTRCSVTPSTGLPDSDGPPETKMTGMFRRIAAIRWPGVILSQLEMHTSASAVWALTMYSIESAIRSRLGSERSEEHTAELQSRGHLVCRLLREKKKQENAK